MDVKNSHSQKILIYIFQTPPFEERTDLGKSLTFLELIFLVNGMDKPNLNLTWTQKWLLSIEQHQENMISLDDLPFLIPLHLVAFWGLLRAFSVAYNIKMLLSVYQSLNMHYILLPM
jgi:hypothetical protein